MNAAAQLSFSADCMQLSGSLDFHSVVPLQREGDAWLREQAPASCRLDMSAVTRCSSAGTTLLLAWLRTATAAGKSLRVEHPPEALIALLQLAGLDKLLKDVIPAAGPQDGGNGPA
ncbi:STAS domain-containing protein [Haliea sp. E17]|uniref:STAS domain-containing protein n=1 Tax=Haliea sp. E17 TaxID=3401576 RepID=UPI003AAA9EE3